MSESSTAARLAFAIIALIGLIVAIATPRLIPTESQTPDTFALEAAAEQSTLAFASDESTAADAVAKSKAEPVITAAKARSQQPEPLPITVPIEPTSTTVAPTTTTTSAATTTTKASATSTKATPTTVPVVGSGPLVIKGASGQVYEGLAISNPSGPCVEINNSSKVTLRNSTIGPCGGAAVEVEGSSGVVLEGLTISSTKTGIYALDSTAVLVVGNSFVNAGRNFVQFDKVNGAGSKIVGNTGKNALGKSNAEDFISVYKSSGTSGSPIEVRGNRLSNGGPSDSGSGIMIGDEGGSNIVVSGNVLMNPGQVGIGVPGGTNIRVLSNTVFSAAHAWSNVGIYVWNQSSGSCSNIEVRGNQVEWYNSSGAANPKWDGKNCGTIAGWDDNNWNANIG